VTVDNGYIENHVGMSEAQFVDDNWYRRAHEAALAFAYEGQREFAGLYSCNMNLRGSHTPLLRPRQSLPM
jgi:hypothetical protein